MSLKYLLLGVLALAGAGVVELGGGQTSPAGQPSIGCPAMVTVSETAIAIPGWSLHSDQAQHRFERISVFNKDGGKDYDLAPDGEKQSGAKVTQTWNLQDYRDMSLFLSCRYQGTSVTLSRELPKPLTTCTQTIELDKSGGIVGQSSMSCQQERRPT
jgi:hypothetical protein